MTISKDVEEILIPILQCPLCRACRSLEIRTGCDRTFLSILPHKEHLLCSCCGTQYPITEDDIPVMWSANMRQYFLDTAFQTDVSSNLTANILVYENISDDYQLYSRKKAYIGLRLQNAIKQVLSHHNSVYRAQEKHMRLYHLDYGCGPGHVLSWLKGFDFTQIGLDVSLKNLRNTRKNLGCFVVCGDACNMPFPDGTIDIITESSALHHIEDWKSVLNESMRICKESGGVIIDSEPSKAQMAWSRFAIAVFNSRFPIYKILSHIKRDKYVFRNISQAKLNLQAEIHHQPGTGFPVDKIQKMFKNAGFNIQIILSPTSELISRANPNWKNIILNVLSARNPWNPTYGAFTAIAVKQNAHGL